VWIDGLDNSTVTLSSGSNVASVASKGTLPLSLASSGTTPVTYTANGFDFTSTSWLAVASRLGMSVNPAFSVVAVASSALTGDRRIVNFGRGDAATTGSLSVAFSQDNFSWRYDGGSATIFAPNANASNMSIVAAGRTEESTYGQATYRFNGESLTATNATNPTLAPTSTLADFRIGFSGLWTGRILGLMILASGSQSAIEQAEGFLAHRHGQAALLPSNHPWKNAPPIFSPPVQPPLPQDPDADMYIAAVEAADGQPLEAGVRAAINAFVVGCKADPSPNAGVSNFQAIEASCILMGARTLAGALVPLRGVAPTNFNFVAGDYSRTLGLVGNGSTKYLNSNRLTFDAPLDNFSMCVNVSTPATGTQMYIGGQSETDTNDIYRSEGQVVFRNRNRSGALITGVGSQTGFLGHSRQTASVIARIGGANNLFTFAAPYTETPAPIGIFCRLTNGSPDLRTTGRMSYYSIGRAVDLAALDSRVTTLRNAIATALA
jgi:hypothetical protein